MNRIPLRTFFLVSAITFGWNAHAQDVSDRAGKMDMSVPFSNFSSDSLDGERGSQAEVDSELGLGFSFAYNVDNHWAFGLDFTWHEAGYTATIAPDAGNPNPAFDQTGEIEFSTTAATATYHFSPSRVTPFLTGNIGRTWVDTNIPAGPPVNVCWWDPWWGQYCGPTVPTKSDVYWSYGLGLGVRWDTQGPMFLRVSANEQWLDVGGSVGTPSFTAYRLDIGARF
jgi:hypothetical protein